MTVTAVVPARQDVAGPVAIEPVLDRDRTGHPRIALTLVLDRLPAPTETDLAPLLVRGVFAMTVALRPVPGVGAVAPEPPFVQAGRVSLLSGADPAPLASAEIAGTALTAVLGATVRPEAALALLSALQGDDPASGPALVLEHDLQIRGAPAERRVRVQGRYADVWDVLAGRAGADGRLGPEDVSEGCRIAVASRVVRVTVDGTADGGELAGEAAAEVLRGAVGFLLREAPGPPGATDGSVYRMQRRPSALMPLAVEERRVVPVRTSLRGRTALGDLLAGVLPVGASPEEAGRIVRLVALHPGAAGTPTPVVPVPRLARPQRPRARRADDVVLLDNRLIAVPLVLENEAAVGSASATVAFERLTATPTWVDATVVGPVLWIPETTDDLQPGPIVGGADAAVLVDRADPARRWYLPEYRVRMPAPGADPAGSPFLFSVATAGLVTGALPAVGLDATIRLTVDPVMGDAARQALADLGNPPAEPVPPIGLTASLEVPYRQEGSGEVQFHSLTGDVTPAGGGGFVLTVRALDSVARLCYGSLAYPGFQSQPAAVVVRYSFTGWSRAAGRGARRAGAFRDVGRLLLNNAQFIDTGTVDIGPLEKTKPGTPWWELEPGMHIVPDLELDFEPLPIPVSPWRETSVGHAARVPAVLPCADHPELYRQAGGGSDRAIGCQDALRLGESPPVAWAEVGEAASPTRRVFRSLQQPGRFVVVPATFRITRRGPDAGDRAFRPSMLINAALGGPDGDRYVFTAALAPAIPLHEWTALRRLLRGLCPPGVEPQLQLPLDPTVQGRPTYRWTVPAEIAEPVVSRTWDGFQIAVSTRLAEGLLLNALLESSGLFGEVEFALPGDLTVSSALVLDTDVTGPWLGSPVTVTVAGGQARVGNRTERTADVAELVDEVGSTAATVDRALAPGAELAVPVTTTGGGLLAVYRLQRAALRVEQLSSYVSDVTTRLSVINLVNYANHGLSRLDVDVRTRDGRVIAQPLEEGATTDVDLTFPITTYLAERRVELRARLAFADGRSDTRPWIGWDLAAAGGVVSLTSQFIGLTS